MGVGRNLVAGVVSLGMLAAAPAASAEELKFEPAGQWALDYGDDYCRLSRSFSAGDKELALAFERIQPGPTMRLILVGQGVRVYRSADELGWDFVPASSERKARFTRSEVVGGNDYYNLGPVTLAPPMPPEPGAPPMPPAYDREAEQAAGQPLTGIHIGSGLVDPITFETGSLGAPVKALQACADDLAASWGIDPATTAKGSTPAMPEGGGVGWLPQGTVPFGDFAKLAGGSNQVRLMVDAAGKATGCFIHWPTLDQAVNDKICSILMDKAAFTPAKDPAGNAVPGLWIGSPMFLGPPFPGGGRRR